MTKSWWWLAPWAALLFVASDARAADEPRFVVDTYDIIGGCPDEAAFHAEVERRVHARTKAPMHVAVHVNQEPRSIEGTVDVIDASGGRSTRRMSATQCSEIIAAAALVVALAIDDAAEAEPAPAPASTPSVAPPGEVVPNVAPLTVDTSRREAIKSESGKSSDLVFRAGAQGALQGGVAPKVVASVPLFVELGSERRGPGFHVEPRARLAWTFAASSRGEVPAGSATFAWMSGAVDLCPVRLALRGSLFDLRACGRVEIGRVEATGEGELVPRRTERRLWLGAGVPFTLRSRPKGLAGLFFEVEAGPRFALVRDRYGVGPLNSLVFQPPAVGFTGGIGAGVSFR